ncbi:MAG TPA: hypothetical protein VL974_02705 [Magnetospirillum sp.]|nr:hypothetical protein [Magnetospirillum sp.]
MTGLLSRLSAVALVVASLISCTWRGGDIGDPLERKTHWFSFVEGEDIRSTCDTSVPDRYRLVFNAVYDEQLRIYELDSLRKLLVIRVVNQGSAARLTSEDLLAPWRAVEAKVQLDDASYAKLVAAFTEGGMFAPPPVGMDLPSHSYFWTAAFCKNGSYGLTAWKYPSPAFAAMGFDSQLFALDTTGIPVNEARPRNVDPVWESKARLLQVPVFQLTVGKHGLVR